MHDDEVYIGMLPACPLYGIGPCIADIRADVGAERQRYDSFVSGTQLVEGIKARIVGQKRRSAPAGLKADSSEFRTLQTLFRFF